jgi:hypothetical protein
MKRRGRGAVAAGSANGGGSGGSGRSGASGGLGGSGGGGTDRSSVDDRRRDGESMFPDGHARVWNEADGLHIDVRGLAPPQPLVQILQLVRQAPPDAVLIVHLHRDPLLLYPELLAFGWWADPLPAEPGEVRLRLARVARPASDSTPAQPG